MGLLVNFLWEGLTVRIGVCHTNDESELKYLIRYFMLGAYLGVSSVFLH